jgi:hypothetical protein
MSLPRPTGTHAVRIAGLLIAALLLASAGTAIAKPNRVQFTATIAGATFPIGGANTIERDAGKVFCPNGLNPYGGAMSATPVPNSMGVGVYPQTFERLGSTFGFHTTVVTYTPHGVTAPVAPWNVQIQVVCGPKIKGMVPIQQNIFLNPGETKSVTATCPTGKFLIGGSFQRTDFTGDGGDFVTASWGVGVGAWMAQATDFGAFGGELNSTAFCSPGPPNYEAESGAVTIPAHSTATATSPACPGNKQLLFGGFGTQPAGWVLFANSMFNSDKTYSVLGYNMGSAPATITAEGYCTQFPKGVKRKRKHH